MQSHEKVEIRNPKAGIRQKFQIKSTHTSALLLGETQAGFCNRFVFGYGYGAGEVGFIF